MVSVKKILADSYNYLYDRKVDINLYIKWKKDLKVQKKLGLPQIMSIDDTLDIIRDKKMSVCRYGDGEFKIIDGESIFFQQESGELADRLKEVLCSERKDVLICLPNFFDRRHSTTKMKINLSKEERKRKQNAIKYMDNIIADRRTRWYSYFNMERVYGDSLISRFYAGVYDDEKSQRWISKWKHIWMERNLLIVEGEKTRLGVGNDLFENTASIRRILAPATGAFCVYDVILECVKKEYKKKDLVLIALGPTATVLAYDLALEGIQAIDIGHIDIEYEWYIAGDRKHGKVKNKFVSEARDGNIVEDEMNQMYLSEIITSIKGV